jgi:hypothetical protein
MLLNLFRRRPGGRHRAVPVAAPGRAEVATPHLLSARQVTRAAAVGVAAVLPTVQGRDRAAALTAAVARHLDGDTRPITTTQGGFTARFLRPYVAAEAIRTRLESTR